MQFFFPILTQVGFFYHFFCKMPKFSRKNSPDFLQLCQHYTHPSKYRTVNILARNHLFLNTVWSLVSSALWPAEINAHFSFFQLVYNRFVFRTEAEFLKVLNRISTPFTSTLFTFHHFLTKMKSWTH